MTVRDSNNIYPVLRKRFWKQSLTVFLKQGFLLLKNMETEIWKDVVGYEGRYKVSNQGRLMSVINNPLIMCLCLNYKGYEYAVIRKNNVAKTIRVHRLIAEAFISNPLNLPQVNHLDGNKANNNIENLEWTDNSGNQKHSYKLGFKSSLGEKNGNCKLNIEKVKKIRELYATKEYEQFDLAKMFDCTEGNISAIITKRNWKHV